ncbi:integrase, partial [Salmonella enterica subsp. enterica]|nr:integrase [Salmonella enterica subsp. enterica serovar Enteritidis]
NLHFHDLRHEAISRLFELGTLNVMEVAAISGHKSLNMLKRYTHLRAYQLVSKLDVRRRQSQKIATYFVPYPAELEDTDDGFNICLPDFEGLNVSGRTREAAMDAASVMLLRRLAMAAQQGERVPRPGDLPVHAGVMIDPLSGMRQSVSPPFS